MRFKTILAAAVAAFATITANAATAPGDTLRVLAIGNSFSTDAVYDHLHQIAAADGTVMVIGNMYIGGCKLERHWANAVSGEAAYLYEKQLADGTHLDRKKWTLRDGIRDEKWDVITMQEGGGYYGVIESYYPYIDSLKAFVARNATNPSVRYGLQQIWVLPENSSNTRYVQKFYDGSMKKMYSMNVATAREVQKRSGFDFVIPTGTAVESLRSTCVRDNVWRDGHHLSYPLGRYTAALTWYETITGRSVEGNSYKPEHVLPLRRELAQKCAHAAVLRPDEMTKVYTEPKTLYDEDAVPAYTLPDPLVMQDGSRVKSVKKWESERRRELLELFAENEYGRSPQPLPGQHYEVLYEDRNALGGLATRKEVNIYFSEDSKVYLTMLLYTPNSASGPVPTFLGVNFMGNWGVSSEEGILMPAMKGNKRHYIIENRERGAVASRWPLEMILKAGYGVATYYRGDTAPDSDLGGNDPLHKLFYRKGQTYPEADEWGAISQWAWGLSRCMDYLETDASVDAGKVAVFGHSRLGKTAVWAGASDSRFAMVISNNSGCGGAAISRRHFGETVETINNHFNHWFCDNFKKYNYDEAAMPVDQHELLALIAPRPLYVASATLDRWSDPRGEWISACEASRVYALYGLKGLVGADGKPVCRRSRKAQESHLAIPMPEPEQPLLDGTIGYHIRTGKHQITAYDWEQYLKFADRYLK